jgi:hypothetical protein
MAGSSIEGSRELPSPTGLWTIPDAEMMRDDHQVCHGARLVDGTKVAFMATADDFAAVTPKNGGKIGSARRLSVSVAREKAFDSPRACHSSSMSMHLRSVQFLH